MLDTEKLIKELNKRSTMTAELSEKYKALGEDAIAARYDGFSRAYKELTNDIEKGKFRLK